MRRAFFCSLNVPVPPQSQTEAGGTILIRVPYLDRVYLPVGGGGGGGGGAGFSQQAEIPLSPHFNVFKDLKASLGSATIA